MYVFWGKPLVAIGCQQSSINTVKPVLCDLPREQWNRVT